MEIRNLKTVNHERLKASFDVVLPGGIQVRDLKIATDYKGDYYIQVPARSYQKDGKTEYFNYIVLPKEVKQQLLDAALPSALGV